MQNVLRGERVLRIREAIRMKEILNSYAVYAVYLTMNMVMVYHYGELLMLAQGYMFGAIDVMMGCTMVLNMAVWLTWLIEARQDE